MGTDAGAYRKLFPRKYIPIILTSVFEAGSTLRKKTANDREDWLTKRLHNRLIAIPIFRDGPLDINLQPELPPTNPESNSSTGKLDFRVSCGRGYEVYFAIEAKRLRVQTSDDTVRAGSSDYVMDGMMRFVSGQYAPYMKAGAMLGYVFDGNIGEARSGIDKAVQNKAGELRLKPPEKLVQSTVLPGKPVEETRHVLEKRDFIIYHVLFAV